MRVSSGAINNTNEIKRLRSVINVLRADTKTIEAQMLNINVDFIKFKEQVVSALKEVNSKSLKTSDNLDTVLNLISLYLKESSKRNHESG